MQTGSLQFDDTRFNSRLSLKPLVDALKKSLAEGKPGAQRLYGDLIASVEAVPELLNPIGDLRDLDPHRELVETLLSTLFPPTTSEHENLYAVAIPFKYQSVYSSALFKKLFTRTGSPQIHVPEGSMDEDMTDHKLEAAYAMIFQKFLGYSAPELARTIYPFNDPATGFTTYMELQIDPRFIDVFPAGEMPRIPENAICRQTNSMMALEELQKNLPLDLFVFEGISVIRIRDVTQQEAISRMKNSLLKTNAFSDARMYVELQGYMQSLIGLKDIRIGITPFFKVNGHYVYSELYNSNSFLFRQLEKPGDKDDVSDCCRNLFAQTDHPIAFENLDDEALKLVNELKYYYDEGVRSLIISPLKHNGELIGVLEIVAPTAGVLKAAHINRIEAAIPLFTLALEKGAENLNNQIDRVIKEKFTAVQPAVEWKFTDAAFKYILTKQENEDAKMDRIVFSDVFPLYGAIDIRNSSTERAQAIQLDMVEQLERIKRVIKKAQSHIFFPLLQEIEFKIDKYISSASDTLVSEDEIQIHEFLENQVTGVFDHLRSTVPSLREDIAGYFAALDPQVNMIYHHRREYEESISMVNETVARFIDREQKESQKVYPHYFERYVTDGVEFNIYIGQSIAPRKKFDMLYLRNMKMWQLSVLAKAARITGRLVDQLPHPLQTTQLILAHSIPISISFRTAERKFDVDGAYNIRYEIIKKRIDKVRIKGTMERLTQPGKIAIVYSQPREAAEYKEYIEFLQNQSLLNPGIEEFELEELQGVIGLKALRVEINRGDEGRLSENAELSSITTRHLIGN